jgi:predicted TIM-barrel fold metal-dependent hydrolase
VKIIDIHCHVTSKYLRNDLIDLEEKAKKYDLKYIFLMSTYFPSKGSGVSNYRLYSNIKDNNLFKMYLSLDFSYFWMAYNEMTEILNDNRNKVSGIKIYTGYQEIDLDSSQMLLLLKLAEKYDLPVVFHTGYLTSEDVNTSFDPMRLLNLFHDHPHINFIIAHLGNPYLKQMLKLLQISNVYADISGLMEYSEEFNENDRKYFMKLFNKIGSAKFLYGTDYPVQTHEQTKELLKEVQEVDKYKIMYSNIKELFNV